MNENKKLLIFGGIIGVIVLLLVICLVKDNQKQSVIINKFNNAFNGTEAKFVFLCIPTCGYCNYMKPIVDNMAEEYNFDYVYFNADEISSSNLSKILNTLGVSESEFGTPYMAVVKGGKVVTSQPGYTTEEFLFEKLVEGGVLSSDSTLALNYISATDFINLVSSNTKTLVVLTKATDADATNMLKGLKEIKKENNINFNVLNLSFLSEDDLTSIDNALEYYSSTDEITGPISLIIENGNVIATHTYTATDDYITFLENNGLM